METTTEILNRYGETMVLTMRNLLAPYSATGKTVKSIRYTVNNKDQMPTLRLYGRPFLKTVETGRGPRKQSQYGGFDNSLEKYLIAKGIPFKTSKSGIKYFKIGESYSSAKSLAYKINKEGDLTHKAGGRDIFSGQLKIIQDSMVKVITENKVKEYLTEIKSIFE